MEAALFDPQDGYYTSHVALGFDGDYLTAPDLGPHFGRALARAFVDLWSSSASRAAWDLVEAGAGRGVFLRDVLGALERERPEAAKGARPTIVEVSPRLRDQQSATLAGRDLRWASDARALAPVQGVIFANEVLDAFPVHVLARTAEGVREVFVEERGGVLAETLRAPSRPDLGWRVPERLPRDGRWEVSPAAEGWVASLAPALTSGYVLFVDYGGDENELLTRLGAGTLRGFSRHRLVDRSVRRAGRARPHRERELHRDPARRGGRGLRVRGSRDAARRAHRARHPRSDRARRHADRAAARAGSSLRDRHAARPEWLRRVRVRVLREGRAGRWAAHVRNARDQRGPVSLTRRALSSAG